MWARTQLKISWCDLLAGFMACFSKAGRNGLASRVEAYWLDSGDSVACYSVRSGFDLLLQALELEEGDEIIFSALNVKSMFKITRRFDLVPVPADLDIAHFGPRLECLEAALTPKSKMLVVAHLFGAVLDMDPIIAFADKHKLILVEDCAQAFMGQAYKGHEGSGVKMFSFGPMKTATALGGALIRVKDTTLRRRMRDIQAIYPVQKRRDQFNRLLKFSKFKIITSRPIMSLIYLCFKAFGYDYQNALSNRVRAVTKLKTSRQLRYKPSVPMLALLLRRLGNHNQDTLDARTAKGETLRNLLGDSVVQPGWANTIHSYWVFPLIVDQPRAYIDGLRALGLDCADLARSKALQPPDDRPELTPEIAAQALLDMVIVPCYPPMSQRLIELLALEIEKITAEIGTKRTKAYARSLQITSNSAPEPGSEAHD